MYKIANAEAPDLRIVRKDLPEQLEQVVARSLVKKPELRYQDGDQFAADLRAVIAQLGGAAAASTVFKGERADGLSLASAVQAQAVAEKTLVMAAGQLPTHGGTGASASSYDPAAKAALADDPFAKTAVFGPSGGPTNPSGGGGQSDSEA